MTKPISFPNFFSPIEGSPAQSLPYLKYHEFTFERKPKKSSFAGIFPWVVAQLVGARSGVLHYLVKKKGFAPYPPSAPPLLIHYPFSSSLRPSVRPPPELSHHLRGPPTSILPSLPQSRSRSAPARGTPVGETGGGGAARQDSRVRSPSAAHPGDPEGHGCFCTGQPLSEEQESTGAPDQPGD